MDDVFTLRIEVRVKYDPATLTPERIVQQIHKGRLLDALDEQFDLHGARKTGNIRLTPPAKVDYITVEIAEKP